MTEPPEPPEPYPAYLPTTAPGPTAPPVRPVARPGHLTGTASGVQTRVEGGTTEHRGMTVLTFRLQVVDRDRPVEVELRAYSLTGTVRDGDEVSVPGTIGRQGRVDAKQVDNLTTATLVGPAPVNTALRAVFVTLFVVIFLAVLIGIAVALFGLSSSGADPFSGFFVPE